MRMVFAYSGTLSMEAEAKRIALKITDLYYDRKKVRETYGELVRSLLNKEYDYYFTEVEMRTYKFFQDNDKHSKTADVGSTPATPAS